MMQSQLQGTLGTLLLFLLGICFVPTVNAISTYDSTASFQLTLVNVTDVAGNQVIDGWSIYVYTSTTNKNVTTIGEATAMADRTLATAGSMGIGDSVFQSSHSAGMATSGAAGSLSQTFFSVTVEYSGGTQLTFDFDYKAILETTVSVPSSDGETAIANAFLEMVDELGFMGFLYIANADLVSGPLSDSLTVDGSFSFPLDFEPNYFGGYIDTDGFAEAPPVPVPPALWLFGSGLLGLVGIARHKKAV